MRFCRATIACVIAALAATSCSPANYPERPYEPPDERLILFPGGGVEINPEGYFALGSTSAVLDANPHLHVLIIGHAEPKGSADDTLEVAFQRAKAARKILLDHGVSPKRVLIGAPREKDGVSEVALSRRVDIYVYDPLKDEISRRLGYEAEIRSE
jgi:outer membrane protein OmpA-like peptidoglycan-associated protein